MGWISKPTLRPLMVVVVAMFFRHEINWQKSTAVCNISVILPYVD